MFLQVATKPDLFSDGSTESKICIVGEAPSAWEMNAGKLFVGPPGRVFEQCLHGAGLIRGELYVTSFIKHKVTNIVLYFNDLTAQLMEKGKEAQANLL